MTKGSDPWGRRPATRTGVQATLTLSIDEQFALMGALVEREFHLEKRLRWAEGEAAADASLDTDTAWLVRDLSRALVQCRRLLERLGVMSGEVPASTGWRRD